MTAKPAIVFDPDRHVYSIDGVPVPSVTQILAPLSAAEYRGVSPGVMERAATLGKAVHRLIELDIARALDEDTLDPVLLPYLVRWREFVAQSGFEPTMTETIVYSARYGYAGTLDLFGRFNGGFALIDTKRTAAVPRTAGPQTAAYQQAHLEYFGPVGASKRYVLHLAPERWRLVQQNDPNDLRVFLSALTLHNWEKSK